MTALPAGVIPLDSEQSETLQKAVSGLTYDQLHWVSGYAAGLAAARSDAAAIVPAPASVPMAEESPQLTILYGSQTGNGEAVAESLAERATRQGYAVRTVSMADYKPAQLKREALLTVVVSTHGEGDPPDDAEIFHEYLLSAKAPALAELKYSVLALGDSSYVNFCQTGRDIDNRLAELGAEAFADIVECDLDYEEAAENWSERVVGSLSELLGKTAAAAPVLRAVESASLFGKSNPFPAEVLVNQKITGGASSKDVRHIELSLEGSGFVYEPGDSLAVIANNPPQLVAEILRESNLDGDKLVTVKDESLTLVEALTTRLEITALNLGFLRAWSEIADHEALYELLDAENTSDLADFVDEHQVIDVVRQFPASIDEAGFAAMLRKLSPRSYSIASSQRANPDEVHITVAAVRYEKFGSPHWGAASTFLADRLEEGEKVLVYIEPNKRFRLPASDVPVIMIGPGTGVAPFRAFVEERAETGAAGDNWLIFGDRNFDSDFLYQLEWQRFLKAGQLKHLDVAFSRDQKRKLYVQDRIRERGDELYRWIENGAAIYVCGDAKHMAGDVEAALLDVIADQGGVDCEAANERLKALRSAGRYQRDVY